MSDDDMKKKLKMQVSKLGRLTSDEILLIEVDDDDLSGDKVRMVTRTIHEAFPNQKVLVKPKSLKMTVEAQRGVAYGLLGMRTPVFDFVRTMEEKLSENDDRGFCGWRDESVMWLLGRIEEEMEELRPLLHDVDGDKTSVTPSMLREAKRECADVGNLAMMIHDVLSFMDESWQMVGEQ